MVYHWSASDDKMPLFELPGLHPWSRASAGAPPLASGSDGKIAEFLTCFVFHSSTYRQIWYLYIALWQTVHVVAWFRSWPMALSCSGRCASLPRSGTSWSLFSSFESNFNSLKLHCSVKRTATHVKCWTEVVRKAGQRGLKWSKCMFKAVPMLTEHWVFLVGNLRAACPGESREMMWNEKYMTQILLHLP